MNYKTIIDMLNDMKIDHCIIENQDSIKLYAKLDKSTVELIFESNTIDKISIIRNMNYNDCVRYMADFSVDLGNSLPINVLHDIIAITILEI